MRKTIYVFLSALIFLIIAELFFGVVFLLKDARERLDLQNNTIDFPYLYFSFKPDDRRIINQDGLYSKAARDKDPGIYRIILTGGSVARSYKAPYDKTISYYLEEELRSRFRTEKIEVINAGMSGYVLEQDFIFIQLVLLYYKPDMIVGLDGYNDMMSFKLNRYDDFAFAPQNWRDFKVIECGKASAKWYYRFVGLFKNTARVFDFIGKLATRKSSYDYSAVTDKKLREARQAYFNILNDIYDFCLSKDVRYHAFLQPVKWYVPEGPCYVRYGGVPALGGLYREYDTGMRQCPYGISLTGIFENNMNVYSDDAHVNNEANIIIAKAMADVLEKEITMHGPRSRGL